MRTLRQQQDQDKEYICEVFSLTAFFVKFFLQFPSVKLLSRVRRSQHLEWLLLAEDGSASTMMAIKEIKERQFKGWCKSTQPKKNYSPPQKKIKLKNGGPQEKI